MPRTARLSVAQLAATVRGNKLTQFPLDVLLQHLATLHTAPETTAPIRVMVAETFVRLCAPLALRGERLPPLPLGSADGAVLRIASSALDAVVTHAREHGAAQWDTALRVRALAGLLTRREAALHPPPADPAEAEDAPPKEAPLPVPNAARILRDASSAVHLAPWAAEHRAVLAAAHGLV